MTIIDITDDWGIPVVPETIWGDEMERIGLLINLLTAPVPWTILSESPILVEAFNVQATGWKSARRLLRIALSCREGLKDLNKVIWAIHAESLHSFLGGDSTEELFGKAYEELTRVHGLIDADLTRRGL